MTRFRIAVVLALAALAPAVHAAPPAQLVLLAPTGQTRDGLPVLLRNTGAGAVGSAMTRGFSGRLLRLYAMEQEFLRRRTGRTPEPAYLLLSDRQGGFPQFGFYLGEEKKQDVGWVDLHRSSRVSGRFGAMDQIFPHELVHVMVRQLAGEPRESGGNQVHAVGVRTDPVNAFSEGFAEHVQILAVDDPDALPDTAALRGDSAARRRARAEVDLFARDLARRWWPVRPSQFRFLLWFSQTEQVLRYDAVRANAFAFAPAIPPSLLEAPDKYDAYLYQCVVPGAPGGAPKPAAVMLSTEGVVAHLFWRVATSPVLQRHYQDEQFYAQFGVSSAEVPPLENVFLKLFVALADGRPSTAPELLRAYIRLFPSEAGEVTRLVRGALLGQDLPAGPEIWLVNEHFVTGTSLFDQFRGLARPHTFDVNAATTLDWLSVPGVTPDVAARLVAGMPYPDLPALERLPGLPAAVSDRLPGMANAMAALLERAAHEEERISLWSIARAYLWRLAALVTIATGVGAWLARRAGARRPWSAGLVALGATSVVVTLSWVITSPAWYPLVAPALLGGTPLALWRLVRERTATATFQPILMWAVAATPALVLMTTW